MQSVRFPIRRTDAPPMFRLSQEIDFCYGHRLLNYAGKCKYLHGHNGKAVIVLEGPELDHRGMLLDFSDIKSAIKGWIDENLDHKLLLNRADPLVPVLEGLGEPFFIMETNPTAENIAKLIYNVTLERGFPVLRVDFQETPTCFASYRSE